MQQKLTIFTVHSLIRWCSCRVSQSWGFYRSHLPYFCTIWSTWSQLPCSNVDSCVHICHTCKDLGGVQVWRLLYQELLSFLFSQNQTTQMFIFKVSSLNTTCIHNCYALPLNAARRRMSSFSRSIVGLRHFTRDVSAICIMLSVSSKLLKLWIRIKVLWIDFIQCCKFSRDVASSIRSSQSMECWETPCELGPQCCAYIMGGNIDFVIPELQMSQSFWRLRSFQLTVI